MDLCFAVSPNETNDLCMDNQKGIRGWINYECGSSDYKRDLALGTQHYSCAYNGKLQALQLN